jgi:hypothetical protein
MNTNVSVEYAASIFMDEACRMRIQLGDRFKKMVTHRPMYEISCLFNKSGIITIKMAIKRL